MLDEIKPETLAALRSQAKQEYLNSLKPNSESWDTHPSEYPEDNDQELVDELISLRVKELISQL